MRPKSIASTLAAAVLVVAAAPPARANLWTGVCTLRLTIQFRSPAQAPLDNPTYDLDVAGLADLDPVRSGTQPCAATFSGTPPFTETSVDGTGSASVWSCAAVVGRGSWDQSFGPEGPAGFTGSHTLSGTWGAWTIEVLSPTLNVVGAGHFTLQAVEATKTPQCVAGSIDSLTLVGEVVFQDP